MQQGKEAFTEGSYGTNAHVLNGAMMKMVVIVYKHFAINN